MKFIKPKQYTPYSLLPEEVQFFNSLSVNELKKECWSRGIPTLKKSRESINKYKANLKNHLEREQNSCCAYCGFDFETVGVSHRDHIAPQENTKYPQFIFEPRNIVLACPICNGFNKKGNYDSIVHGKLNSDYSLCLFTIVHPYFDVYDDHIIFNGKGATLTGITKKGKETINLFGLDSIRMSENREMCINWDRKRIGLPHKLACLFDSLRQKLSRR